MLILGLGLGKFKSVACWYIRSASVASTASTKTRYSAGKCSTGCYSEIAVVGTTLLVPSKYRFSRIAVQVKTGRLLTYRTIHPDVSLADAASSLPNVINIA